MCLCTMSCLVSAEDEGVGSLELDGQLVVSHYASAGNWTQVLWRGSQCWVISLDPCQGRLQRLNYACTSMGPIWRLFYRILRWPGTVTHPYSPSKQEGKRIPWVWGQPSETLPQKNRTTQNKNDIPMKVKNQTSPNQKKHPSSKKTMTNTWFSDL